MSGREDRLYDLLPAIYRQRDAEQGYPLQALLRVIAEQVNVVEDDIARLYDNWFIETCDDWVVPYIGDLIGYRPVHDAGEPGDVATAEERWRNKILIPRREVANTLRYRRRKGTLALLPQLALDVAGWPARAVELYRHLAFTQHLNHLRRRRGHTVDLRRGEALDRLAGPFDELAHNADLRRVASPRTPGRPNLQGVGLYVWRLRSYSVSGSPAYCVEKSASHHYTFSVLGNDAPLYLKPQPESEPTAVAEELNLPIPLGRRAFESRRDDLYGEGRSLQILRVHKGDKGEEDAPDPVQPEEIVVADLSGWHYQPNEGQVAVDPELGRIMFPRLEAPKLGVRVFYHYGFSADLGGGEYDRPLSQPADALVYRVGETEELTKINQALDRWGNAQPRPRHAVIEITDSRAYTESIHVKLAGGETLQLRAAQRRRPVIRLLDRDPSLADALVVEGEAGSVFVLDGLLVTGRGLRIERDLAAVTLRHVTLVPGWSLDGDCSPREPGEPSLELVNVRAKIAIEHSIVGFLLVNQDQVATDPVPIRIRDSVVDATSSALEAVAGPDGLVAHARLTIERSTIVGQLFIHALELGENSLFTGLLTVARRQIGCLRFSSYVPGSRTPRRFECQPDLALAASPGDPHAALRVRPRFRTMRYGSPDYARLSDGCAPEIRRGADDESEMGAFHDLFEPQRAANLAARLDEHTPAGSDAGLIYAD